MSKENITIIVPVRVVDSHTDALERLGYLEHDTTHKLHARVMIVDDGSTTEDSSRLVDFCQNKNYEYVYLNTQDKVFSISRCRNEGAKRARTRYIFFQDIDLAPTQGFYERLALEVEIVGLSKHNNNMIMIPVAYLTEAGAEKFLGDHESGKLQRYQDAVIHRDQELFEKYSSGTSACVYDRYYYLSCGGNVDDFAGWGYEDLEFNNRVVMDSGRYPLPKSWQKDVSTFDNQTNYRGWKSAYRLFGDRSFSKGLLLFHVWHPVSIDSNYRLKKEKNLNLFRSRMKRFSTLRAHEAPLPAIERGKTLLFRKNAFTFATELQPLLGEVVFKSEQEFNNKNEFISFYRSESLSRVIFHNPYANNKITEIYHWAQEEGLEFFIAERGALNSSVFFDSTGFLCDSKLFTKEYWDFPLSDKESERVVEYIRSERRSIDLLERQGGRRSVDELRAMLGISNEKKVILVCLQRPDDTATCYFEGKMGSYNVFLENIRKLAADFSGKDYVVLIKPHPLEDEGFVSDGIDVGSCHLYDLLDISNFLIVFNSGTGVQALMFDLPVITCGQAFYDSPELTVKAESYTHLREIINSEMKVNRAARERFIHYLIARYYSFGLLVTRQSRMENGARMTATTKIIYDQLRFDGIECNYFRKEFASDDWQSMLFDRYRGTRAKDRFLFDGQVNGASFSMAKWIYRVSRRTPIFSRVVDVFVPVYTWLQKYFVKK